MSPFTFFALFVCASAACSATLIGVATSSFDPDALQTLVTLDAQTGAIVASLPLPATNVDSVVPNTMVSTSAASVAVCTISPPSVNTTTYCIVELAVADGAVLNRWCSPTLVLDNVAWDGRRLLATAFDPAARQHLVYEANRTGLVPLFAIPRQITIQVALSAFSVAQQHWYLLDQDAGTGKNQLVFVDMASQTTRVAGVHTDTIELLALDSRRGRLFVWTAACDLVDVGQVPLKTLLSYPQLSADGGQSAVLIGDGTLRARLLDANTDQPSWLVFDPRAPAPPPKPQTLALYPWVLTFSELLPA